MRCWKPLSFQDFGPLLWVGDAVGLIFCSHTAPWWGPFTEGSLSLCDGPCAHWWGFSSYVLFCLSESTEQWTTDMCGLSRCFPPGLRPTTSFLSVWYEMRPSTRFKGGAINHWMAPICIGSSSVVEGGGSEEPFVRTRDWVKDSYSLHAPLSMHT